MEEQQTQPNVEQKELDLQVDERQQWEQPKLEQLVISVDTSLTQGSASDGETPGFGG